VSLISTQPELDGWIVESAQPKAPVTARTEIITIKLDCGCEVIYKELGAVSCADHCYNDPLRQKTEF
jgi:hypothetical protein